MEMEFRIGQEISLDFGISQGLTAGFGLGADMPESAVQVIPVIPESVIPVCEN